MSDLSRTDWHDWLQHPATKAFIAHAHAEWGAGGARFEGLIERIADRKGDPAENMLHMQQVAVARRQILQLLKWPEEEMQRLRERPETAMSGSRRGSL